MLTHKLKALCCLTLLVSTTAVLASEFEPGRRFYEKGDSLHPVAVTLTGGIEANATAFPCKSCHGIDGQGGIEGGVNVPPINWRKLSQPLPTSEKAPYDEQLLHRAITQGVKSDGQSMHRLMPRYDLSDEDFEQLAKHLKRIDDPIPPGVDNTHLKIGVVLSEAPGLSSLVADTRSVFSRYFQQVNDRGGIHGRRIELIFTPPSRIDEDVLCYLTGPLQPNEASALRQFSEDTPILFPLSEIDSTDRTAAPILPSLSDQLMELIELSGVQQPSLLVTDKDALGSLIRQRISSLANDQSRLSVITSVDEIPVQRDRLQHIFWFTRKQDFSALITAVSRNRTKTAIYSSVDILGNDLLKLSRLPDNIDIYLSNPRGVPDQSSIDYKDYLAFIETHQLPTRHSEWNRMVYLVSTLTHETLRRSSRRITRQRLLGAASSFHQFPVGVTHPITTTGENTQGSQLLRFDADFRRLMPI